MGSPNRRESKRRGLPRPHTLGVGASTKRAGSRGVFPTYRSDARRGTVLLASAIVIFLVAGLAFAAFPVSFLIGTDSFWSRPAGDTAEHIIGGRYFIADAWRFPLLFVPRLGVPAGTNIGLTDSIPLAALAAKLGRVLWGWQRPYLPVWILFCWIAQGVAGVVSLYVLQVRRVAPLGTRRPAGSVLARIVGAIWPCGALRPVPSPSSLGCAFRFGRHIAPTLGVAFLSAAVGAGAPRARLSARNGGRVCPRHAVARPVDRAVDCAGGSRSPSGYGGSGGAGDGRPGVFHARAGASQTLRGMAAQPGSTIRAWMECCYRRARRPTWGGL